MKSKQRISLAFVVLSVLAADCADVAPTNHRDTGLTYYIETRKQPPMRLFVAEADLTNPHVHVRVAPGGPAPDSSGKWQTTLMQPTKIATREGFDLVVNGDFFSALKTKDPATIWATVTGPAVTDGNAWATADSKRPCFVMHKNKKAAIEMRAHATPDDWEVVAGNIMLVKDGVVVPRQSKLRYPRTAVGLDAQSTKLVILVVDGRKPGVSVGMSTADTAAEMLRLGCRQAINLDDGGSSMMAVRDPATHQMRILNTPSDGRERPVANTLGISVDTAPNH